SFIGLVFFSGLASLSPNPVLGAIRDCLSPERSLPLYNPNTKESLHTTYWSNGRYQQNALSEINHIMRDRRTGEIKPIHTDLLDLLYAIGTELKTQEPFHIISGYRSSRTNALLRKSGKNVAKNSLHIQGKAADIRLPECRLSSLRRVAFNLKGGGVGYYPRYRFIHIDVGPLRYWSGQGTRKAKK
ncbi:MAG: DUF882 domain-containing protein, partial [Desulfobacterales bacterium]|nr:DUF882 domain-containing protein [Desulfobacterales bacterium]